MATDPTHVWMNNTGTGPIAVPLREVEGKLKQGWLKMQPPSEKPAKKKKPTKE